MKKTKPNDNKIKVEIIESERGWGQRVDEVKYFSNKDEATKFCNDYNKENDKSIVPDWYMYAIIIEG